MTRRVVLDGNAVRIAAPGYHADTANIRNLQFSSEFSQLAPLAPVEMDCNWNEGAFRTYPFPKSFPSPPIVHFQRVIAANQVVEFGSCGYMKFEWEESWQDGGGNYQTARHNVYAYATSSALMIRSENGSTRPDQVTPPPFRLRYTVMDYNL